MDEFKCKKCGNRELVHGDTKNGVKIVMCIDCAHKWEIHETSSVPLGLLVSNLKKLKAELDKNASDCEDSANEASKRTIMNSDLGKAHAYAECVIKLGEILKDY